MVSSTPMPRNSLKPLKRFAQHSTTTCAAQATKYGKCILNSYMDVTKDMCRDEFAEFRKCLKQAVSSFDIVLESSSGCSIR